MAAVIVKAGPAGVGSVKSEVSGAGGTTVAPAQPGHARSENMTRSIFDPEGGETEHSGQRFTPERADQISQMPPDVDDGNVSEAEAADLEKIARRNERGQSPA